MVRRGAVVLTAVFLLAACGSSSPTATPGGVPSPTAATSEAPSPTPFDVPSAFLGQLATATAGQMELAGTFDVGSTSGIVSGTLTYAGADSDQVMTITFGATSQTTETIHKGGVGYTRKGDGPWTQDAAAPASGKDLGSLLKGITSLTDAGAETKGGVELHRLELPATTVIDPAIFGLTDPAIVGPKVALIVYAKPDGAPAIFAVTVSWTQSGQPVKMALELRFVSIDGSLSVAAPDHVWTVFTSSRFHYTMAYPDEWDASTSETSVDRFVSPGDMNVVALRATTGGLTLNEITKAEASANKKSGFILDANVATKLAGKAARLLTYHVTISKKPYVAYEVLAVDGAHWYDILMLTPPANAATDLATFQEMLGTFAFG